MTTYSKNKDKNVDFILFDHKQEYWLKEFTFSFLIIIS